MITCANCGHENPEGQRFCGMCGSSLEKICPRCSTPAPANARFCGNCGSPLDNDADRNTIPAAPLEERRIATVAFADLSGFTALSGQTDPEEVRALVDRCMTLLGEIIERYGGDVDKIIGDAILAVWGVPIAREDHAERAVRAALEMQECASKHEAEFGGLPLRIGINTGELMFAPVGPERHRAQTVMGDVVNVASRLQTSAPRGGILVGEETWRATRRAFRYEQVEPFRVKGKDAPLDAWLATGALGTAPAERPLSDVPMVGRDLELEMLSKTWQRLVDERRPHFAVVLGAPGIGKSRLCREFREHVEATGGRVIRSRCLPYGERPGFGAFAETVKDAASIFETDSLPDALEKLRERTGALLGAEGGSVAEILAVLAGLDTGELENRTLVFDAARRFVEALGAEQPTVLGFEDLQWAEPSLLDLIEHLAARLRNVPVMLLASARPELLETRPGLGGGLPAYMTLVLDALGEHAADELTRELLRGQPVAPAVLERIRDVAGGNPLFIEELASSVAEGTTDPTQGLPTSVVSVIAARLDALPPHERRILLVASVIGKTFWRSVLAGLDPEPGLDDALASLEAREFIWRERVSEIEGDDAYAFRHMSLLEVAYNTLPRAERRRLHGEVAALLETAFSERPTAIAPMMAHHWQEAGDPDRAVDYLLRAAEQADQAWAKPEAVELYSQALNLLGPDDQRRRSIAMRRAVSMTALSHIYTGDVPAPSRLAGAGRE